jgi:hypothetical protein
MIIIDSIVNRLKINKERLVIFSLIFILKIFYLVIVFNFSLTTKYTLEDFHGDGVDYLKTSLNLVNNGEYRSGFNDGVTEYVYRMPGMASILAPLLFLFSISSAIKIFIIFQVLLLSIAVTYLFFYLKNKCRYKIINGALFLFLFLSIGSYLNQYSSIILSETIAISLFIIVSCYLLQQKEFKINLVFFLICMLFTWLFFLRPFMIVFLPLFCIRIAKFPSIKQGVSFFIKSNKPVILLIGIIIFFTGLWTLRNYVKTKEFIFMEYSIRPDKISEFSECAPEIKNYIVDFGGDFYTTSYNSKTSNWLWFYSDDMLKQAKLERPPNTVFPSVVFGDGFTIDSLQSIRTTIESVLKATPKSDRRKELFEKFEMQIKRAKNVLENNINMAFKIKTKKDEAINFLYQPTQDVFNKSTSFFNIIFLYLNAFLNVFFISLIILVSIFAFINVNNFKTYYYIYIPSVFLIMLYVAYFTVKEQRGLFCYYPAFLIMGMNANHLINSKTKWIQVLKVIAIIFFVLFLGVYGVYISKKG